MRLFIYLLLFVVIVAFGLTFSLKNPQHVVISYYPDLVVTLPLSVALLVTLLLGVLLGALATSMSVLRKGREVARLRKANDKLDQELQNLRSMPIKDSD